MGHSSYCSACGPASEEQPMSKDYRIDSVAELEGLLGEPFEEIKFKIRAELDDVMAELIGRSPLVFVATLDNAGPPAVSRWRSASTCTTNNRAVPDGTVK